MATLSELRQQKDDWFRADPGSPIPAAEQATFPGLRYFPEAPALRLRVTLERFAAPDQVQLATTTGDQQWFIRWGEIHFAVDGQPARLTVFYSSWGGYFVPFSDATSGHESYAAGRYLEPDELADGILLVDFNLAYNPFCAYSDEYSCPLPPAENWLDVPIRAGELAYAHPADSAA